MNFSKPNNQTNKMNTTAIQKPIDKKGDIRSYIQSDAVKKQISLVIPKHLTADVMARVVCTAILKTPRLAECRIESLLQSIMLLSQFGLLPDGRSAHLIPYFNSKANAYDCQAIIDWKGKVARATENGVENIAADVVCFNDKFTWKMTPDGLQFDHEIDFRNPDRGAMFAAYVIWRHAGKFSGVIMTKLEIDGIRKRSKSPDRGPWQTDYNEMAKKTVVHRASKLWPLDAKFKEAIEVQEVKEATIDLPALPAVEDEPKAIELDEVPMEAPTPLASKPVAAPEPANEETPGQLAKRMVIEAGVPLELFVADVTARNLAADADSWPDYEAVPMTAWEILGRQQKTLANLVKKFGTAKK
jgi:recombination protein RecT